MRKKHRRPRNAVMRTVEDAIESLIAQGKSLDVATVTSRTASHMRVGVLVTHMEMLLAPFARKRLIQRGIYVIDEDDYDRTDWAEMGVAEYDELINVKQKNVDAVSRHLRAEQAVRKYLDTQQTKLGRAVTAGEFEDKIVAIYDRYGISV